MAREARVTILITAKNAAKSVFAEVESGLGKLKGALTGVTGMIGGALGIAGLGGVAKYLYDVNAETDKLLVRLKTFEGSTGKARAVFTQLQDFANKTPYELQNTTEAYLTLRTAAIEPTMETMRLFGDHAAAFGRDITEYAVAVRSAISGEMEPLRGFGVQAAVQGDKLRVSFRGVTTTIGRDAQSIVTYLENISKTNFGGAMADQAETLGGTLSTLQDSVSSIARAIGDAGFTQDVHDATKALTGFTDAAGNAGVDRICVLYLQVKALGQVAVDAVKMVGGAALLLPVTIARLVTTTVSSVLAALGAMFYPVAAFIDGIAGVGGMKPNLSGKLGGFIGRRTSAAGTQLNGIKDDFSGLTDLWSNGFANADAYDRQIASARNRANASASAEGATYGFGAAGGLKETGGATAPTTPIGVTSDLAKKAEAERKRRHKDAVDEILQRSAALREQLELVAEMGGDTKASVADMVEMERVLARAAGATRDPDEQRKFLRAMLDLRQDRHERRLFTDDELAGQDAAKFLRNAPTAEGIRAGINADVPGVIADNQRALAAITKTGNQVSNAMKEALGPTQSLAEMVGGTLTSTMFTFGSAVEQAFGAMATGAESAGKVFASAMLGALGDVAAGFASFFMARAGGELADGIGALANPLTAPKAAVHFASAAKWTAAAFGMEAVAGLLHGAAHNVAGTGSSGRAGAASTSRALGSQDQRGDATLVIEGGILDMSDYRQAQALKRALESLSGRRVTIKGGMPG